MHNVNTASTSHHLAGDLWEAPLHSCPYPTSDLRSANPVPVAPPSTPPQARLTSPGRHTANPTVGTKYPTAVPRRAQIELGVWSDGTDRVLSAAYPDVQRYLACARDSMNLPAAPSDTVFALAALEVFYHPADPVHWMFWKDERKYRTAEIVSRISLHRPQLIQSRVAWNGTPEYLSILASHHVSTWRPLYETKDWFQTLVPPKVQSPGRPNLRKRKPAQVGLLASSGGHQEDDSTSTEEPVAKRKRIRTVARKGENDRIRQVRRGGSQQVTPSISVPRPEDTPSVAQPFTDAQQDDDPASANEKPMSSTRTNDLPVATRASTRRRKGRASQAAARPTATPDPLTSRSTSPTPTSRGVSAAARSNSRNRSTSQASANTLVAARDRRSLSVLSAVTAVDSSGSKKDGVVKISVDRDTPDSEVGGDLEVGASAPGMITRGRANRSRTAEMTVGGRKTAGTVPAARTRVRRGTKL